ncbi:methyltransferase [Artemisia annua]|uniref:Methyltransferase n=1 Tax=Artemisia annua TaxID=35608 RepID=A0A2U1QFS7_ARTAN|nr:methyltransferase [Artemisia annua]
MAVSLTPSTLSWLHLPNLNNNNNNNPSNFFHRPLISTPPPSSTVKCSSSLKSSNSTEEKRELLKQYGLDPDEYLSEPTPKKGRRKKEQQKDERRKPAEIETTRERIKPRETHKLLQVLGGTARRKKLLSPKSMDVRPMMEVVKGAAFGILQAAGGCPTSLRPGRWLDLYSGTGSVGIEAISRGCSEVHFVEMDPWVVSDVLRPNLEWTGFLENSVIHTLRVETYLERTKDKPFDYISVTPPYMLVDYEILMKQITESSVIGDDSFIVVEYPFRTDMLETCGCLVKIADRRFGRTHLAIYGPKWAQKKERS